jgi:superfamily II RNA helicase
MTQEECDKALDALDSLYLKLPTTAANDICRIIVPLLHRLKEAERGLAYEYGGLAV